jgi:hypothetical protein
VTYSNVDSSLDVDRCVFPVNPEAVLFVELASRCTKINPALYDQLFVLYMFSGDDMTLDMMLWAKRNGIAFDCPYCCGAKVRQAWGEVEGGELELKAIPCYCYEVALRAKE